jgi:SAM-dependent methyltransferase
VSALPDEAEARREWLTRWGAEQEQRMREAERRQMATLPARAVARTRAGLARIPKQLVEASALLADRVLDRGLHTSGGLSLPEHHYSDRLGYEPSAWYVLPRALWYLGVSDRDTFVDFGCGKGRVVHQAAMRPFRRVIGVEISPALAEIARAAVAARRHQHRCHDVEIVVADAAEFRVPDDLTIGYFFHPFSGNTLVGVMRGIVDSLDRNPRRVRLIYAVPHAGSLVLATGRFRLVTVHRALPGDRGYGWAAIFESY